MMPKTDQDRELIEVARCMVADGKEEYHAGPRRGMKNGVYGQRVTFEVFIPDEEADNG